MFEELFGALAEIISYGFTSVVNEFLSQITGGMDFADVNVEELRMDLAGGVVAEG